LCLFCLVYFFSIFGVWFVHALLLVGDEADELTSELTAVTTDHTPTTAVGIDQILRDLRVANERLTKVNIRCLNPIAFIKKSTPLFLICFLFLFLLQGMNEEDVWGVAEILWRLTNSGGLNVNLIRETRIGKSLGGYCKRTCGRCNSPDCDYCELIAVWKQMVWESTTSRGDTKISESSETEPNRVVEKRSPPRNSLRLGLKLPSIPEFREHTNSTESINSELDQDFDLHHSRSEPSLSRIRHRSRNSQRP
jgi:hypothetical protein